MNDTNGDEPVADFDQTNGQAPGLDGDDDGAITDEGKKKHGVLADLVEDVETGFHDRDEDDEPSGGETSYSEEGRP